jgi:hypothetical protein
MTSQFYFRVIYSDKIETLDANVKSEIEIRFPASDNEAKSILSQKLLEIVRGIIFINREEFAYHSVYIKDSELTNVLVFNQPSHWFVSVLKR